ncbi:MAG TPA: AAA family ATPase [Amycolatopsis sp.]|jgi:chloramphenicol 3-O phosphotransferase
MGPGRVILLNGPSSSGKSAIGRAMLPLLPDPWFLVPVDGISGMRSTQYTRAREDAEVREMLRRTRRGYHRVVAALVSTGNDVIMDYPLSEPWRLDDLLDVLDGYDVTLVEVRCSAEELDRRERARGDRPAGLAASQTQVYSHEDNDIVVDTTHRSAADCAREVVDRIDDLGSPKAFERLRAARTPQE